MYMYVISMILFTISAFRASSYALMMEIFVIMQKSCIISISSVFITEPKNDFPPK